MRSSRLRRHSIILFPHSMQSPTEEVSVPSLAVLQRIYTIPCGLHICVFAWLWSAVLCVLYVDGCARVRVVVLFF